MDGAAWHNESVTIDINDEALIEIEDLGSDLSSEWRFDAPHRCWHGPEDVVIWQDFTVGIGMAVIVCASAKRATSVAKALVDAIRLAQPS